MRFLAVLLPGLAFPALLAAQPLAAPPQADAAAQARMYEDVETLRRILNRTLNLPRYRQDALSGPVLTWQQPNVLSWDNSSNNSVWNNRLVPPEFDGGMTRWDSVAAQAASPVVASLEYPAAQGVYLKGYGVVYSLTLPQPVGEGAASTAKPAPKPVSEWERVRRELHGEKIEAPVKGSAGPKPTLTERILRLLAENGRHFTQLGADERITVAITFPKESAETVGRAGTAVPQTWSTGRVTGSTFSSTAASGASLAGLAATSGTPAAAGDPAASSTTGAGPATSAVGVADPAKATSTQDYELLGDLQLKQGRTQEAIKAYQRAIELKPEFKRAAELHRKLARAYLSVEAGDEPLKQVEANLKRAEENMRQARQAYQQAVEAARRPKPEKPAPVALPGKLIISANKRLLDQVGAGNISFEEFRRQASVEYLPFTPTSRTPEGAH